MSLLLAKNTGLKELRKRPPVVETTNKQVAGPEVLESANQKHSKTAFERLSRRSTHRGTTTSSKISTRILQINSGVDKGVQSPDCPARCDKVGDKKQSHQVARSVTERVCSSGTVQGSQDKRTPADSGRFAPSVERSGGKYTGNAKILSLCDGIKGNQDGRQGKIADDITSKHVQRTRSVSPGQSRSGSAYSGLAKTNSLSGGSSKTRSASIGVTASRRCSSGQSTAKQTVSVANSKILSDLWQAKQGDKPKSVGTQPGRTKGSGFGERQPQNLRSANQNALTSTRSPRSVTGKQSKTLSLEKRLSTDNTDDVTLHDGAELKSNHNQNKPRSPLCRTRRRASTNSMNQDTAQPARIPPDSPSRSMLAARSSSLQKLDGSSSATKVEKKPAPWISKPKMTTTAASQNVLDCKQNSASQDNLNRMFSVKQRPKFPSYLSPTTSSINKAHPEHLSQQGDSDAKASPGKGITMEVCDSGDKSFDAEPVPKAKELSSLFPSDRGGKTLTRREAFKPAGAVSALRTSRQSEVTVTKHGLKYSPKEDGSNKVPAKVVKALRSKVSQWAQVENAKCKQSPSDTELSSQLKVSDDDGQRSKDVMLEMPTELQLSYDSGLSSCEPSSPNYSLIGEQSTAKDSGKSAKVPVSKAKNELHQSMVDDKQWAGLTSTNSGSAMCHRPPQFGGSAGSNAGVGTCDRVSETVSRTAHLKCLQANNGILLSDSNKASVNTGLVSWRSCKSTSDEKHSPQTTNISEKITGEHLGLVT